MQPSSNTNKVHHHEECDYLVVGAGTSGMSFIDTLLTESSTATVILVDRNDKPGGHWTTAYPFVRLHQCSGNYGVNSEPLGKNFNKKGYEKIDPNDRATAEEIVEYYGRVLNKFQACDRFKKVYFESEYQKEEDEYSSSYPSSYPSSYSSSTASKNTTVHSILDKNGDTIFITCKKIVLSSSKVVVPSMRDAPFPVHKDVNFVNVNQVPQAVLCGKYSNYVVIGTGKTGVDAIIELSQRGIDQSCIKWIVSQDVWYFIREKIFHSVNHYQLASNFFVEPMTSTQNATAVEEVFLEYEKNGLAGRIDPAREFPKVFKAPTIDGHELELLRSIKDVVRLGRISSIEAGGVMQFGKNEEAKELHLASSIEGTVFIDCMAEDFLGLATDSMKDLKVFNNSRIYLGPLFSFFNISYSAALTAYLEVNIEDNNVKNNILFYTKKMEPTYQNVLCQIYCELKTAAILVETFPPAAHFLLNSRTNVNAPIHHSFFKLLWYQLGPAQLLKKTEKFLRKVESGGFTDLKIDPEMIQREKVDKIRLTRAQKREIATKQKKLEKVKFLQSYPSK